MTTRPTDHPNAERRRYQPDRHDSKIVQLLPRKAPIPTMDFGSGWYHDDAITVSRGADSHRCM